jgi:hypothetical protein
MPAMFGPKLHNCRSFIAGMVRSYAVIVLRRTAWEQDIYKSDKNY